MVFETQVHILELEMCVLPDGQHLRLPLQPQIVCASPRPLAARVPFFSASAGWAWRPNIIQNPATSLVAPAAYYCLPALGHLSRAQEWADGTAGGPVQLTQARRPAALPPARTCRSLPAPARQGVEP